MPPEGLVEKRERFQSSKLFLLLSQPKGLCFYLAWKRLPVPINVYFNEREKIVLRPIKWNSLKFSRTMSWNSYLPAGENIKNDRSLCAANFEYNWWRSLFKRLTYEQLKKEEKHLKKEVKKPSKKELSLIFLYYVLPIVSSLYFR